jgi:hypothetical protein
MSDNKVLLEEFEQMKKDIQQMGKDIEDCFAFMVERVGNDLEHMSEGICNAIVGLKSAILGESTEIGKIVEETPEIKPDNKVYV